MKTLPDMIIGYRRLVMMAFAAASMVLARATPPTVPELGVIFNDDTELLPITTDPSVATTSIEANVDSISATTIIRNVAYGSDLVYYNSSLNYDTTLNISGNDLGWRPSADRHVDQLPSTDQAWANGVYAYQDSARHLIVDLGYDPIAKQADRAKATAGKEKFYFLAYRMNDHVGLSYNKLNPNIGKFRYDSYSGTPPADDAPNLIDEVANTTWDRYYDYTKTAVYNDRLALIGEFLDRYADKIDGIQLDFERTYTVIPPGTGIIAPATSSANTTVITNFVTAVRAKLDALATARSVQGKQYFLLVRVPSTVRDCEWCGIDIKNWITNRLVDVVMPALFYDTSLDFPIKEFVDLAEPVGAKVYPSVISSGAHYTGSRLFKQNPGTSDSTAEDVFGRIGMFRGAVVNYRAQGAAGFEMFNFALPLDADDKAIATVLATCPFKGLGRTANKTFAVTPRRENLWRDVPGLETLPLPVTWTQPAEKTIHLTLNMQEIIEERPVVNNTESKYLGLRFACTGVTAASELTSVKVNGVSIYPNTPEADGDLVTAPALVRTTVSGSQSGVPVKTSYLQLEVPNPHQVFPAPLLLQLTNCTTALNGASVTCPSTSGLIVGMGVYGTDIPPGTQIATIASTTVFTLTARSSAAHTGLTLKLAAPPGIALSNCATTVANATVTCTSTAGLYPGMSVVGAGVPAAALISSVTSATQFTLNATATASGSGKNFNAFGLPVVNLTGCATTQNSETVTCTSTAGLLQGMLVAGTGIPAQATVTSVTSATAFQIGVPATANGSGLAMTAAVQPGVYDLEIKFLSPDSNARKLTEVNVGVLYNPW